MSLNFNGNYIGGVPSGGGGGTPIDSSFSRSSSNPIQNSTLTDALFYKDGDVISLEWYGVGGYVTLSKTQLTTNAIIFDKSFKNIQTVTINSLVLNAKMPTGGSVFDTYTELVTEGNTFLVEGRLANSRCITIYFPNAIPNPNLVNNTPLNFMIKKAIITVSE